MLIKHIGLLSLCVGLVGQTAMAVNKCAVTYKAASAQPSASSQSKEISWRKGNTRVSASGKISATTKEREQVLLDIQNDMIDEISGKGQYSHTDVPFMVFVEEAGASVATVRAQGDYGSGKYPIIKVTGLGPSGVLKGTLAAPVSGHTGLANAVKWSKTDTFFVYLEGKKAGKTHLVNGDKSLDMVTFQELDIKLSKDEPLTLYYYRSGSGGPGGFIEGRALEIHWDGQ